MSAPSSRGGSATDLVAVLVLTLAADVALLAPGVPDTLAGLVAVPFLLVCPGYALVAALLPVSPASTPGWATPRAGWPIRLGLSLALSVLTVGVVGVLLSRAWTVRLLPSVVAVSAVIVAGTLVAWHRRRGVRPERRATPLRAGREWLRESSAWSVSLAVALLALAATVAFAGATPVDRQAYSEFYLLGEGTDGELAASELPQTFVAGESRDLHVAVENHEHRAVDYEVVVIAATGGSAGEREVLDRFDVRLEGGERAIEERSIALGTVSNETRLEFLLYEGGAASRPDPTAADVALDLGVDVVASGAPGEGTAGAGNATTADGPSLASGSAK